MMIKNLNSCMDVVPASVVFQTPSSPPKHHFWIQGQFSSCQSANVVTPEQLETCYEVDNRTTMGPGAGISPEALWTAFLVNPFHWWDNGTEKKSEKSRRLGETDSVVKASDLPESVHGSYHDDPKRVAGYGVDLQVGTWSKLYGKGHLAQAVEELDLMVQRGSYVDRSVFFGAIKTCTAHKNLFLGSRVHALSVMSGYESNSFLANHLICMYAAHGRLKEGRQVFAKVASPDRYMWASIILAHARHGQPKEAIHLYRQMRASSVRGDNHIFAAVIKACATAEDLSFGRVLHADIMTAPVKPDLFVRNSLVDMYAKCGSLEDARRVFDSSPVKDVVTWNAMIAGYAQHGHGREALLLYDDMQREGCTPANRVTFVCLLRACTSLGALLEGKQLHAQVVEQGLESEVIVGTCLVDMYSKCGCLEEARDAFNCLAKKDVVAWTAMIAGYAQRGLCHEALALYSNMQEEGIVPADDITFVCLLQACASAGALKEGRQLHAHLKQKRLEADVVVGSSLVNMYAKCGCLEDARKVFDSLSTKDIVTWNVMITGYAQHGLGQEALTLYESMQEEGITPADVITFVCLLQACASAGALRQGKQLHLQVQSSGLESNVVVGNCLLNMYAKCGSLEDARRVFDNLPTKDVVTWTTMIAGYAQHGLGEQSLAIYESMQQEGITLNDAVTCVSLLQACGSVADLRKGKEIHDKVCELGLETDLFVASSLIDMYGKCGNMSDARRVFDALPSRDTVAWNALVAGYARQGETELVFDTFHRMTQDEVKPNGLAFLSVLTVCSHVGLVEEGKKYFDTMLQDRSITPELEHYTCMIDILGRAGQPDKAMEMVKAMPFQPDSAVWSTVLAACWKSKNVAIGREAFENAIKLDKHDDSAYVLMSNVYSAAQMPDEAKEIHAMRMKAKAFKQPGQSWWTDTGGTVHTFRVNDATHCDAQQIHAKVRELVEEMKQQGYVPHVDSVLAGIPDADKEAALCGHSEKLAIAHALLKTEKGTTIRVMKNLRVCEDCHSAIGFISKIEQRTIICRDATRFHVYKDGKCSCGDYW